MKKHPSPFLGPVVQRGLLIIAFLTAGIAAAAESMKKTFNLPAGAAGETLKQFAAQAGREIVFAPEAIGTVQTKAVQGELTPPEALNLMLADTGLAASQDPKTRAFAVRRGEADPNAPRVAPLKRDDRPQTTAPAASDQPIQLSPFEVTVDNKGYYGANAMSGTRLNTRLEDLPSAISVVTKEQMQDFALLDLNDIFAMEVSTEGTSNYTDLSFTNGATGIDSDFTSTNPVGANRIRGIAPANMAFGNFETSGRVPVDPIDIDAVEISRGPNTSVFGMGKGSGTVNSVPAAARLAQNSTELVMRVDNREGWRTSLDVNRVLKKDVAALRFSGVLQREGYPQKPSGMDTRRLNGMIKLRPFKTTTLSATFNRYDSHGNRPLSGPIREGLTAWLQAGAPTWDPITTTAKINGVTVGTFATATPAYFQQPPTRFQAFIDRDTPAYLGLARGTATTPSTQTQAQRLMISNVDPTGVLSLQPLLVRSPVATGKDLVDWSTQNPAAMNHYRNESQTSLLTLQQGVFDTRRQSLNLELAVFGEHNESYTSAPLGATGGTVNFASALMIDVNERLLDGRPNPFFKRPYMDIPNPIVRTSAVDNRTYRGQLAYKLDLRNEPNAWRWLGLHQLSGYGEYKDFGYRTYAYRQAVVDDHAWIPAGTRRAASYNFSHRYYVGDAQGYNMDYTPVRLASGQNTLHWGNSLTGAYNHEPVTLADATNNATKDQTLVKSVGGLVQSYFFHDRLVTTLGIRRDERSGRTGLVVFAPDGNTVDYQDFDQWSGSPWVAQGGTTTTAGGVFKVARWLSVHGNKSYSFQPGALTYSVYRKPLPSPSGEGTDFGFTLNLLEGKLNIRVNRYQTLQLNSTSSSSGTLLGFAGRLDFIDTPVAETTYNLQARATGWVRDAAAARGVTLSDAQVLQQVADIMKLPVDYLTQRAPGNQSALDDLKARGTEVEINYNPNGFITTKLNVAQQEAFNSGVAAEVVQWVAERLPVWQSVVDPTTGQLWWNSNYTGIPRQVYEANIAAQLRLIHAAAGKSRPQVRKYRANFAGNFRLSGITDHSILRNFTVGGGLRWEDRGAIGYWGVQKLPAIITDLDVNRPIWDSARLYADAFVSYRTRVWNKVRTTFQLNVRNFTEGGRLQPVYANPDGSIAAYRTIDPRLFVFTATFNF